VLARITYLLVIIALGCLVGGFFTRESNVLLFVSIGLSVVAIALVLVGWARRSREAPLGFEEELAYADEDEDALLSDEELAFVEERTPRRTRTKSTARPRTKPKATKAKAKAKPKAKPRASSTTKAKPAARKAKPKSAGKPQARPKRKPPRPRPETP
jgi:FtsZ-interacting cell division protein ZipA